MTWFIVVGRCWGDDEATALAIKAKDRDGARKAFKKRMNDFPYANKTPAEGPGAIWVDQVFDCGENEPKEIS
jgi:hypothetical protein